MQELSHKSAISCSNVSKVFYPLEEQGIWKLILKGEMDGDGFKALHNISLNVSNGEFVGLLGLNGSGKSTLLRTVSGIYSPTSGKVEISGDVSGLYELGVSGNEELTGREFAERWLSIQGIPHLTLQECLIEIHEFSELDEYYDQVIRTYSAGMKVRLFFSVATTLPERVFLIDEALTVGDEHFVAKCWRRMRKRITQGSSGILATHDWGAVLKLCRQAYVLDNGEIVDKGRAQAVVQQYLGLEPPAADQASFRLGNSCEFRAESGKDALFEIPVEINEDLSVYISASVELFHQGFGWQHILHFIGQKVAQKSGSYIVRIKIPSIPLASGEYSLNLFLASSQEGGEGYDCRSWTYNNGLKLVVTGQSRESVAMLPMLECSSAL